MGEDLFELGYIPAAVALIAVCVAVYTDMRWRIIPNKLNYPLIAGGVLFYVFWGLYRGDVLLLISGAMGAAIAFAISYAMWVTGGWAGGDVKLLTALGALLPMFSPPHVPAPYSSSYPFFSVTILLNSVIAATPVVLVYAIICWIRGRSVLYERVKITELKEGMIPAETIYEKDGKIWRWSSKFRASPDWDRVYTNPKRAAGLTRYQIGMLRRLVRERKLGDEIKIKKGVPFAPALAAGTFIAVLYGDLYWKLVLFLQGM